MLGLCCLYETSWYVSSSIFWKGLYKIGNIYSLNIKFTNEIIGPEVFFVGEVFDSSLPLIGKKLFWFVINTSCVGLGMLVFSQGICLSKLFVDTVVDNILLLYSQCV